MEIIGCLRNVLLEVNIVSEFVVQTPSGVTLRQLLSVSALSVLPLWLPVTHGVASARTHTHTHTVCSPFNSILSVKLLFVLSPLKKSKNFHFHPKPPSEDQLSRARCRFKLPRYLIPSLSRSLKSGKVLPYISSAGTLILVFVRIPPWCEGRRSKDPSCEGRRQRPWTGVWPQ